MPLQSCQPTELSPLSVCPLEYSIGCWLVGELSTQGARLCPGNLLLSLVAIEGRLFARLPLGLVVKIKTRLRRICGLVGTR